MTVENSIVLPVGSYFVTYTPPKPLAGCKGFTRGYSILLPAIPLTYTLPAASRRGGLMVSAALLAGPPGPVPTKVAQTSALPAGLSLARKPRFMQLPAEGQGVVLFAPGVAGKS